MTSLGDTLLFFIALGILFFLPGWILLRLIWGKTIYTSLESLLFSFGISIGMIDFLLIALGTWHIHLNIFSLLLGIFVCLGVVMSISRLINRRSRKSEQDVVAKIQKIPSFSKQQGWLFVIIFGLTIFIKTIYLTDAVLPTATDLGHHMYWSQSIALTESLPFYAKQGIETNVLGTYMLTDPQPIADFIIGEHLPFSAINMFVGLDFFSAFPVLFLFFINILSLLTLVMLALRFSAGMKNAFLSHQVFTPQNIALMTLFLFGPLYTLASPEAKFVSGGVVGNVIGNFFIPLIFLALFRALKEKQSSFLALALFLIFTLAYTHHLSTLILFFGLFAALFVYSIAHYEKITAVLFSWWRLFAKPAPILTLLFCIIFFFGIAMPTYIETNAVGTALGTPTKSTRTGLSLLQIDNATGQARVAIAFSGVLLFILLRAYRRYAFALLLGWFTILLILSFHPEWLFINIPSNRIVTYLSFPLGLLTAFSAVAFFATLRGSTSHFRLPSIFILLISATFFVFVTADGSFDNNQTLLPKDKALGVLQTFNASRFLATNSTADDIVVKDHNYITADSWMKLFFVRDYAYPLSRGYFKRYEDNPNREQCTSLMISVPNTVAGKKCYSDLSVRFVVINPRFDTAQFEKSTEFSRIYASDDIHIYERK
ncbi:MAG: hypothetical protein PHH40_01420 [Candidatus Moranbacteria bacterium]|nr:hypothetical protein [Candidatus Moranbacteria bacterium]MDD3965121.1 hypothetical protein [Candidatus Moranbacteria bacterium]